MTELLYGRSVERGSRLRAFRITAWTSVALLALCFGAAALAQLLSHLRMLELRSLLNDVSAARQETLAAVNRFDALRGRLFDAARGLAPLAALALLLWSRLGRLPVSWARKAACGLAGAAAAGLLILPSWLCSGWTYVDYYFEWSNTLAVLLLLFLVDGVWELLKRRKGKRHASAAPKKE